MPLRAAPLATTLAVIAVFLLSGCAQTVSLDPAADAGNPGCASIIVRLPPTVAGKGIRETDAQATGAWGTPTEVLLRCGVKPIGPTTQPCITVNGVDWVLETSPTAKTIRYITFGRVPATEVVINHGAGGVSDASVLPALADAVSTVKQTQKCLDILDVPSSSPTPSATPAPTRSATPTPAATP